MTKNEVVRISLEGEDYIQINELTSRIVFDQKMSARKEKEAVILLALDVLGVLVGSIISKGSKSFVPADVAAIIKEGYMPESLPVTETTDTQSAAPEVQK